MRRRAAIPARLPGARRALSSRERSLLTLRSLQPAQLPRPGGTRASASPSLIRAPPLSVRAERAALLQACARLTALCGRGASRRSVPPHHPLSRGSSRALPVCASHRLYGQGVINAGLCRGCGSWRLSRSLFAGSGCFSPPLLGRRLLSRSRPARFPSVQVQRQQCFGCTESLLSVKDFRFLFGCLWPTE